MHEPNRSLQTNQGASGRIPTFAVPLFCVIQLTEKPEVFGDSLTAIVILSDPL